MGLRWDSGMSPLHHLETLRWEISASELDHLLEIARTSFRGHASVSVQDDERAVKSIPIRPEIPLALRSSMFAGSSRSILGCQEAKQSADPSASPLWLYPLRT